MTLLTSTFPLNKIECYNSWMYEFMMLLLLTKYLIFDNCFVGHKIFVPWQHLIFCWVLDIIFSKHLYENTFDRYCYWICPLPQLKPIFFFRFNISNYIYINITYLYICTNHLAIRLFRKQKYMFDIDFMIRLKCI